jgi:hypothetical protein
MTPPLSNPNSIVERHHHDLDSTTDPRWTPSPIGPRMDQAVPSDKVNTETKIKWALFNTVPYRNLPSVHRTDSVNLGMDCVHYGFSTACDSYYGRRRWVNPGLKNTSDTFSLLASLLRCRRRVLAGTLERASSVERSAPR